MVSAAEGVGRAQRPLSILILGGTGFTGRLFWVVDQLDSLAGMLLLTWPVWQPPLTLVVLLVAIMLVAHPLGAWVMVLFGLKDRIG